MHSNEHNLETLIGVGYDKVNFFIVKERIALAFRHSKERKAKSHGGYKWLFL